MGFGTSEDDTLKRSILYGSVPSRGGGGLLCFSRGVTCNLDIFLLIFFFKAQSTRRQLQGDKNEVLENNSIGE